MSNKTLTLGIINHRYANIHSVKKALEYINCNYTELNNPSEFNKVDAIILPGVGAFDAAMQVLNDSCMSDALLEANNWKNVQMRSTIVVPVNSTTLSKSE